MSATDRVASGMATRSWIALGLVALLSLAAYVSLRQTIATQETMAAIVNFSGTRRFTSQRAALFCLRLVTARDDAARDDARRAMQASLERLKRAHDGLIHGDPQFAKDALTPARLALTIANVQRARHDRDRAARADAALRTLVEASAPALGQEVLPVLVRSLAAACHARHAFVAELIDEGRTCRIQALWSDGGWKSGREYPPVSSPCRHTLLAPGCRYDRWTGPVALGLEARFYVGTALRDARGRVIGVLALLDDQPLDDHPSLQALLTVTAARCASEVQRAYAEQALALGYRLERGLAACARTLLGDGRNPRTLDAALRPLAEATDAARVVLYGHEPDEIEGLRLVHLAEACRGQSPPSVHQRLPYRGALRRWQNELGSGEHVSGLVRMLPGGEQAVLAADQVLAVPLVARNR